VDQLGAVAAPVIEHSTCDVFEYLHQSVAVLVHAARAGNHVPEDHALDTLGMGSSEVRRHQRAL
jgi:hypothetical protein